MAIVHKSVLVLCKTYPSPSGKYAELSCVAGMEPDGSLIRIFPVPFRHISQDRQFKKWQWIDAKFEKARRDHRPESHTIKIDTLRTGKCVSTKNAWEARRELIKKIPLNTDFAAIEQQHEKCGASLALLKPKHVRTLEIRPTTPDWSAKDLTKLTILHRQGNLFEQNRKQNVKILRKLPFDFYYHYKCETPNGSAAYRHKIVDWEIGALYWKCRQRHGNDWELPFRSKMEQELPQSDLMFLMGNMHRYRDQWLIISIIYPPKVQQLNLFTSLS
ncbi:hypothetical protein ACFFJB_05665 [Camelimonas abortus]|uniref:Uncharacterized protein n=1 Tax=Camelimonas abortus TaxID=1017184 RepID=A0ABV7LB85_9HYPH